MAAWKDPRPNDTTKEGIRARLRSLGDYLRSTDLDGLQDQIDAINAAITVIEGDLDGKAWIVNTDGDSGTTIYVGSIDPDVSYTPVDGDVWIEVP